MKAQLSALLAVVAVTTLAAEQRGVVRRVQVSQTTVEAGQPVSFTVTGANPCGAVNLTYGDGQVITHPISELPATITHNYASAGSFRVIARGMGNCDGEVVTTLRVNPGRVAPPQPQATAPLDRNSDGIISRSEWSGDEQAFRAHDWNRDGILSGDEKLEAERQYAIDRRAAGRAPGRAVEGSTSTIPVRANQAWTDTGMSVRVGEFVSVDVAGTAWLSALREDMADVTGTMVRRRALLAPLPDAPAGVVIGRIGNGAPFDLGSRRTPFRAPADGRLFVGLNELDPSDNQGTLQLTVSIDSRAR